MAWWKFWDKLIWTVARWSDVTTPYYREIIEHQMGESDYTKFTANLKAVLDKDQAGRNRALRDNINAQIWRDCMGTDEKPNNRLYNQPPESPSECPYCSHDHLPDQLCTVIEECSCGHGLDMCGCLGPPPAFYCSTCGVILGPVEAIRLDLGYGPELLCDACLGINNQLALCFWHG